MMNLKKKIKYIEKILQMVLEPPYYSFCCIPMDKSTRKF